MKVNQLIIVTLVIGAIILIVTGCEFNVDKPMWDNPGEIVPATITSINPPDRAAAGVNYITITGENFSDVLSENIVYFDSDTAEKVSGSATQIIVRRPNIFSDSVKIKIVTPDIDVAATYENYRIDRVMEEYGFFIDDIRIEAIAVDSDENLYVCQYADSFIYRVSADGLKETPAFGKSSGRVFDAKIGPEGTLIMVMGDSVIRQMNVTDGTETVWATIHKDVELNHGDFDSNHNFYTGGDESGLFVVCAGETSGDSLYGLYEEERCEILDMKVHGDRLYILCDFHRTSDVPDGLYYHEIIGSDGSIGPHQAEFLWESAMFADASPSTFAISENGLIYFGTDNENNPVMVYDPDTENQDSFYKGIIPSNAGCLEWGEGNYLYMIRSPSPWTIIRLDMGEAGTTYYGRQQ